MFRGLVRGAAADRSNQKIPAFRRPSSSGTEQGAPVSDNYIRQTIPTTFIHRQAGFRRSAGFDDIV
jgi:hypothetical protein